VLGNPDIRNVRSNTRVDIIRYCVGTRMWHASTLHWRFVIQRAGSTKRCFRYSSLYTLANGDVVILNMRSLE
jgi:hypothetical protein